jgi:hypothetical protein|nr:MAG TPA: protein of unknown function (DUF3861) [Caudoviricetes sp.]
MNLDKCIRILLTKLSEKYKVTLVEIIVAKEGKISKNYSVSFEENNENELYRHTERFKNKRELVSWLICQK